MSLFDRVVEVEIGRSGSTSLSLKGLRVAFNIDKTTDRTSNAAIIDIYNLSDDTRNRIGELDQTVTIRAGYRQASGAVLLFTGDIVKINHTFPAPDIITRIAAGDGIMTLREKRISVSYKEGTSHRTVLEHMAGQLGLTLRVLPEDIEGEYIYGFSYMGSIKSGLNKVAERLGLEWSIQNGELQVLKLRSSTNVSPRLVTYSTGLLSSPEAQIDLKDDLIANQENPGYTIRMLLAPDLEPAQIIWLRTDNIDGTYRINRVIHDADNEGRDFITLLEVTEFAQNATN